MVSRPSQAAFDCDIGMLTSVLPLCVARAEENIGIDPTETAVDGRVSAKLDFGICEDGDLGLRMPEAAYYPQGIL